MEEEDPLTLGKLEGAIVHPKQEIIDQCLFGGPFSRERTDACLDLALRCHKELNTLSEEERERIRKDLIDEIKIEHKLSEKTTKIDEKEYRLPERKGTLFDIQEKRIGEEYYEGVKRQKREYLDKHRDKPFLACPISLYGLETQFIEEIGTSPFQDRKKAEAIQAAEGLIFDEQSKVSEGIKPKQREGGEGKKGVNWKRLSKNKIQYKDKIITFNPSDLRHKCDPIVHNPFLKERRYDYCVQADLNNEQDLYFRKYLTDLDKPREEVDDKYIKLSPTLSCWHTFLQYLYYREDVYNVWKKINEKYKMGQLDPNQYESMLVGLLDLDPDLPPKSQLETIQREPGTIPRGKESKYKKMVEYLPLRYRIWASQSHTAQKIEQNNFYRPIKEIVDTHTYRIIRNFFEENEVSMMNNLSFYLSTDEIKDLVNKTSYKYTVMMIRDNIDMYVDDYLLEKDFRRIIEILFGTVRNFNARYEWRFDVDPSNGERREGEIMVLDGVLREIEDEWNTDLILDKIDIIAKDYPQISVEKIEASLKKREQRFFFTHNIPIVAWMEYKELKEIIKRELDLLSSPNKIKTIKRLFARIVNGQIGELTWYQKEEMRDVLEKKLDTPKKRELWEKTIKKVYTDYNGELRDPIKFFKDLHQNLGALDHFLDKSSPLNSPPRSYWVEDYMRALKDHLWEEGAALPQSVSIAFPYEGSNYLSVIVEDIKGISWEGMRVPDYTIEFWRGDKHWRELNIEEKFEFANKLEMGTLGGDEEKIEKLRRGLSPYPLTAINEFRKLAEERGLTLAEVWRERDRYYDELDEDYRFWESPSQLEKNLNRIYEKIYEVYYSPCIKDIYQEIDKECALRMIYDTYYSYYIRWKIYKG